MQIKINGTLYPAEISGRLTDRDWDGRESKSITLEMTHAAAEALFADGAAWSIVDTYTADKLDDAGEPTGETETVTQEYDNSEFSVAGEITDHRDGTVTVKMGKATALEDAYARLYGGDAK